jgi:hypothetical protein
MTGSGRTCFGTLWFTALLLAQSACGAGWHRIDPVPPAELPEAQQVQVWQEGQRLQLHSVMVTTDSVAGVPYTKPRTCDSCRTSLPSAAVDSLRVGDPTGGFFKTVGLTIVTWFTMATATYFILGKD